MTERPDEQTPSATPDPTPAHDETTDPAAAGAARVESGGWSWRRPWSGWSAPGQWSGTRTIVAVVAATVVGALGALGAGAAIAQSESGGRSDVGRGGQGQFPGVPGGGAGDRDDGRGNRGSEGERRGGGDGDRGVPGQDAPGSSDPSDANGTPSTGSHI